MELKLAQCFSFQSACVCAYVRVCMCVFVCVRCLNFRKLHFFISLGFIGFFLLNIPTPATRSTPLATTTFRLFRTYVAHVFSFVQHGDEAHDGAWSHVVKTTTRRLRSKNNLKHTHTLAHTHSHTRAPRIISSHIVLSSRNAPSLYPLLSVHSPSLLLPLSSLSPYLPCLVWLLRLCQCRPVSS